MRRVLDWMLRIVGVLALLGMLAGMMALAFAPAILVRDDMPATHTAPMAADAIVSLAGDFRRAEHAATLYRRHVAPVVYISAPPTMGNAPYYRIAGVDIPPHHEVNRAILQSEGVPASAIRTYGYEVISTVEEAEHLREALRVDLNGQTPFRLVVVTSATHTARAGRIFEQVFPRTDIRMSVAPGTELPTPWWSSRSSAVNVVLEVAKTVWHRVGGVFRSSDAPASTA